jgi:hypothetical protein
MKNSDNHVSDSTWWYLQSEKLKMKQNFQNIILYHISKTLGSEILKIIFRDCLDQKYDVEPLLLY